MTTSHLSPLPQGEKGNTSAHPTVSVCIAVKRWNAYVDECYAACQNLVGGPVEFLVFPDEAPTAPVPANAICIPTGPIGPAEKRDWSLKHGTGEIIAFLDDDTYPVPIWLAAALPYFKLPEIAAVCGPAVTPPQDDMLQRASGAVYESWAGGGPHNIRYVPAPSRLVDDFPSCNFLIRKSVFQQLGGFQNTFWPGEDTILCLKITQDLHLKIQYDPRVLVYHHRRKLWWPHIKQVANYGLHRGFFAKRYPATSRRLSYFLPLLLVGWFILGGLTAWLVPSFYLWYLASLVAYGTLVFLDSLRTNWSLAWMVAPAIVITHVTYGVSLLKGLLSSSLKR